MLRSLKQKKYRIKEKLFVAEGTKITFEAIKNVPHLIHGIYSTHNWSHDFNIPDNLLNKYHTLDKDEINKISNLTTPQEVLVVLKQDKPVIENFKIRDITILLDGIKDPGNLGTIIRIADWFGIKNIVCSDDCVDCYNPKVIQSTMGSIFRANIFYTGLEQFVKEYLSAYKVIVYGASLTGNNIYNEILKKPAFIIIGSESHGISKNLSDLLNNEISIPSGVASGFKTESLNAAIASGIICAEFFRQFTQNGTTE